jgi:hypothetical protein
VLRWADIEDKNDQPVIVNLIQNPPVTHPDAPCAGIAHKRCGLPRARVLGKTIDGLPYPLLHGAA